MGPLVWSRVSQGGWVRSEGDKDYSTILVIANFIVVDMEPGISHNLVVFRILPERWDQSKRRFCGQPRGTMFNGKFEMQATLFRVSSLI